MCGPLAMMLGKHRYRFYYFGGRLLSFTLAGAIAGEIGAVINVFFNAYHIGAAASLVFGTVIFMMGLFGLMGKSFPGQPFVGKLMARATGPLSLLMLRDQPLATFMFGFLAIALPCGQSLVVFSACALSGSLLVGTINGFAFAAITSPSLYFAMNAYSIFGAAKKYYNSVSSVITLIVGTIALCRAFAELDLIPHIALSFPVIETFHIALF